MSLAAVGKTFADFEIGAPDAEADRRLASYFVRTPYVDSALNLRRALYLGRKGSGKSALFTQLGRLINEAGYTRSLVIAITPDQYAWNALRQYSEGGLLPEQAHSNAWKLTIAIEIAAALSSVAVDELTDAGAKEACQTLRTFLEQNYGSASKPNLMASATRLLKGIKSFNVSAFGFGAGLTREIEDQLLTPQIIDSLLESISRISREVGIVVALDKLDDSWEGSDQSKQLLIGLLKASKELNDRFRGDSPANGLAVLVFLRTDIYEGLRFDDKDKHRATEENIVWTPELLKDMVKERLPEGVAVDELFEPGEMRGSISPFNYIVKRTFLRPREVLQFLQECIRRAGPSATFITKDQVREAEERYSSWKVEDLKQEYRRLYPDFDELLESLRQGLHRYDSMEEIGQHLQDRIPRLVDEYGTRRIIELLFNASAIGVRLGNSGSAKFRSEDSDLVLPAVGAVYVHQCLYRGLSLREKRAREDGGLEDVEERQ
ncbi:hypothetical protein HUN39_06115 [Methylocystis sp. FS]|uniref:P-loop ATPase, Sll1717 family n=1 Tax=Methylocystis silviterrae TaxID=2743612 RepID=UPI001584090F|nr:hypothetical protein [Methylocystis silviterrae]NUJ79603.1 hypothetical protein [Methylocystis silviterrae]